MRDESIAFSGSLVIKYEGGARHSPSELNIKSLESAA